MTLRHLKELAKLPREQMRFEIAIDRLHSLLRAAEAFGYTAARMTFIDGFLACLCIMSGENICFRGSKIYYKNKDGEEISLIEEEE